MKKIVSVLCLIACLFAMTSCADVLNKMPPSASEMEEFIDNWNLTEDCYKNPESKSQATLKSYIKYANGVELDSTVLPDGSSTNFFSKPGDVIKLEKDSIGNTKLYVNDSLITNPREQNAVMNRAQAYLNSVDNVNPVEVRTDNSYVAPGFNIEVKRNMNSSGQAVYSTKFRSSICNYDFSINGTIMGNKIVFTGFKLNGHNLNQDQYNKWDSFLKRVFRTLDNV